MTFTVKVPMAMALSLFLFSLVGCGEKTVVGESGTKYEQSQTCIGCHDSAVSPGTGRLVVEEWKLSHHNTSNAAGCADCHEPAHSHPTGCNLCHGGSPVAPSVTKNPDTEKKCAKCHGSVSGLFPLGTRREHYGNTNFGPTIGNYSASYISTNYIGKCRKCHNPHDPTTNIEYNRVWAKSGHGEINAGPYVSRDFKLFGTSVKADKAYTNYPRITPTPTDPAIIAAKGTAVCVRCHTTSGYVQFVSSAFKDLMPFGDQYDKTKEVIGCDACHSGYNFKVRDVANARIYFNFSSTTSHAIVKDNYIDFPNLRNSNVCVPCHAGRGSGQDIVKMSKLSGINFAKIDSPGAHDFSGAGLLTAKIGYEFDDDKDGIVNNYVTGIGANTGHDTAGLSNGKGPCITCHMSKAVSSESHTFKPVIHSTVLFDLYTTNQTWAQVYSVPSASPVALKISSITSQSCNTSGCHVSSFGVTEMNIDKEGYISALAVLNKWARLVRNVPVSPQATIGIPVYDSVKPSLTYPNAARSTTKWNFFGDATAPDLMGAAFNLSMFNNEPGAYTHNPLYAKRLIFDSIKFLSSTATATTLGPLRYPYEDLPSQIVTVYDAIRFLETNTKARTLEVGPAYVPDTRLTTTIEVVVKITKKQADSAIMWLYGSVSPLDTSKRPGN